MTIQKHIDQIKTFKQKAGQSTPESYVEPSREERILLARLAMEETLELIHALGVEVEVFYKDLYSSITCTSTDYMHFDVVDEINVKEVMDACCDIFWVGVGGPAVALGISDKLEACLNEVGESNLSKFIDGYKCPDTGKWIKGKSYKKPDIENILNEKKVSIL